MPLVPPKSQRPLVARFLTIEPLTVAGVAYNDLDHLLSQMGVLFTAEELADEFLATGLSVDVSTLYRWRREGAIKNYQGET